MLNDGTMASAQVPEASRDSLQMLLQQLARASAVGLIDLGVPKTGLHARTGAAGLQPTQQSSGHGRSLERPQEEISTRGQPRVYAACMADWWPSSG